MAVKKIEVVQPPQNFQNQPSADFNKKGFDNLIWQKGYRIIVEKAIKCPCQSPNTNQLSSCKNCGGIGWLWINPKLLRAVMSSMNLTTQYRTWSEVNMGIANITTRNEDRLSYRDKVTIIDEISYFSEVRHISLEGTTLFAYTSYNIKDIEYAGLFVDGSTKLTRLTKNTDYTIRGNVFYLDSKFRTTHDAAVLNDDKLSVTLRYSHPPQYLILDITRDVMKSWVRSKGKESITDLPLGYIGRRLHFVADAENLSQTRLLDNSYLDDECLKEIKDITGDLFDLC